MTNYNERLEQQLFRALTKGGLEKEKEIESKGRYIHRPMKSIVHEEVQAITSLIKELVEEAKPAMRETQRGNVTIYSDLSEIELNIIDELEQNLLKALEEV